MDFTQQKQFLKEGIAESEKVIEANRILKEFDWHFVNPYLKGFQVESILNHYKSGSLNQEKVTSLFIKEFFDLPSTSSFIDGFFKRSKFIEPFNYYIEYSLILCFQQDYAGAINLIIPCIEGMLTNYILIGKNQEMPKHGKRYDKIRKVIDTIKQDLLESYSQYDSSSLLNRQQHDYLITLEREYLDNWFSVINSFLNESIFAHTDALDNGVVLNRHLILHQFKINNYQTLENYIKLFNAIKFISWGFLKIEKLSPFNEISNEDFMRKWIQYKELIKKSRNLLIHKQSILNTYDLHDKRNFNLFGTFSSIYAGTSLKHRLILKLGRLVENNKNRLQLGKIWGINLFKK